MTLSVSRLMTCLLLASGCLLVYSELSGQAAPAFYYPPPPEATEEFTFQENDSITYTLKLALDGAGAPAYFYSNIFTPVCFTHVCKPVYINFYWDLLGNYTGYNVPPGEPLTKLDHREFEPEDYNQLHRILSNTESILRDFSIYDLVDTRTYQLSDSVDAVTGATPKTIKNEVISGAVYTCYTLWHLANGNAVEKMRSVIETRCDDNLLHNFLKSSNHHYQYWAMDKVIGHGHVLPEFLPDILSIIEGKNIFAARYALDRIPPDVFAKGSPYQSWIWTLYKKSSYALQLAILDKVKSVPLSEQLSIAFAGELKQANEEQFGRLLHLLTNQNPLPEKAMLSLTDHLRDSNTRNAARAYQALVKLNIQDGNIKKRIRQFEKSNPELVQETNQE